MTFAAGSPSPPRLARWLMSITLAAHLRVAAMGDMQEEFGERRQRDGDGPARRWYWQQTWRSLGPKLRGRRTAGRDGPHGQRQDRWMNAFGQDLRFALRLMRRQPLVTAIAVWSLGLGVALSAGVFGLLARAGSTAWGRSIRSAWWRPWWC